MLKKFKELPTNAKLLVLIAGAICFLGVYGILRSTYSSDEAISRRESVAYEKNLKTRTECERQVEAKYYGEYNSKEFRDAMRKCQR